MQQPFSDALARLQKTLDGLAVGKICRAAGHEAIDQLTVDVAAAEMENIIMAMVAEGIEDASDWRATKAFKATIVRVIKRRVQRACLELARSI